tara:strand:- start:800 stop:1474 length:675 start_codon:yes stop_codon:yes gene_type:complete
MIYISFTGAQCTGKSTLLRKIQLSSIGAGWELIPSVTRLVREKFEVDINEAGNDDTQLLILAQHLANSIAYKTRVTANGIIPNDGVIMDRCIIDGMVYTQYLYDEGKVSLSVLEHAEFMFEKLLSKLDVVFYTCPEGVCLEDDGERSVDKSFRDRIINEFEDALYYIESQYGEGPEIVRLEGGIDERYEVINNILKRYPNAVLDDKTKGAQYWIDKKQNENAIR